MLVWGENNMEKSSLGLPAGSVRAILALAISGVALATVILNGELPSSLTGIWGSVIAYYFASKQQKTITKNDH